MPQGFHCLTPIQLCNTSLLPYILENNRKGYLPFFVYPTFFSYFCFLFPGSLPQNIMVNPSLLSIVSIKNIFSYFKFQLKQQQLCEAFPVPLISNQWLLPLISFFRYIYFSFISLYLVV